MLVSLHATYRADHPGLLYVSEKENLPVTLATNVIYYCDKMKFHAELVVRINLPGPGALSSGEGTFAAAIFSPCNRTEI